MENNIDVSKLLQHIETSQIGYNCEFSGPFGSKRVVYADYTASGRSLSFIEEYIATEVLPCYANTHTTTSYTSKQSTQFREEARSIIKESLNCTDEDALIFTGTGCTGAIHKLVNCLTLNAHNKSPFISPPIIFVSPFEHHSNLLPWKELKGAEVIRIKENAYGELDLVDLESKLVHHFISQRTMIGAFNAGSNITGVLTDVDRVSSLMHTYGGLVFWDYAAAAPYVKIDMNPVGDNKAYKDGVYFSMHKFVGGPDTPGVLVAKKSVFKNRTPHIPGGGTVEFVTQCKHRYLEDIEAREEGGTPSIIGAIRAGLAIQLKEQVGSSTIMGLEEELSRHVFSQWSGVEELVIVGPQTDVPRLPIFSFLIKHPPSNLFLHHYFVAALLNDLFGIQARGGCSCAGPYGQALLNIPEDLAMQVVMDDVPAGTPCNRELTKPGMTRVNFPYFMSADTVNYITQAVTMVAKLGWKLLGQYSIDPRSGTFRHTRTSHLSSRKHLRDMFNVMGQPKNSRRAPPRHINYQELLAEAQAVFDSAFEDAHNAPHHMNLHDQVNRIRWFLLPEEAWQYGHGRTSPVTQQTFTPKVYLTKSEDHLKTQPKQPLSKNKSFRLHYSQKEGDAEEIKTVHTIQVNSAAPQPYSPAEGNVENVQDENKENETNFSTGVKPKKSTTKAKLKLKSIFKARS